MSEHLRWGILSTANINKALIPPIRTSERSELVGVASRDADRAKEYASQWQIPRSYGDYESLLADPEIDVVYLSLPNSLHAEWTVKAADAGKHVLCEKPLTVSLEQHQRVEAAAERNGVMVVEAFMYLHHPQTLTIRSLIDEGRLGQLQTIHSWFHFFLPPERSENIRLSAGLDGGSLWDVGVYPTSMAVTMAMPQAPHSVFASQIEGESGVDVAMRGQIHFHDGLVAQISSGFRTPFREGTHLVGSQGILEVPHPWKPGLDGNVSVMKLVDSDGGIEEISTPAVDPYLCEVEAMERSVLEGAPPLVSLAQSRHFLSVVLALYESARNGKMVTLSE